MFLDRWSLLQKSRKTQISRQARLTVFKRFDESFLVQERVDKGKLEHLDDPDEKGSLVVRRVGAFRELKRKITFRCYPQPSAVRPDSIFTARSIAFGVSRV